MRFSKPTLLKVVAFSFVCLIFTLVLGVRLGNFRLFADQRTYEAEFANASGVNVGDAVKVAGVDVGRVEGRRIEDGRAVISFSVQDDVKVTEDSTAAIRWRNVMGQRFVYLYPGDEKRLEDGGRIPIAQTEPAGDIGELLNNIGPVLRAIDPDKANLVLDSVNTALRGNEHDARELLEYGSALAADLGAMDREIASMVDSSDEILAVFADQDDRLDSILDDLNTVGGALDRTTGELNTVITDFAEVQKHLNYLVTENRDQIDSSITNLGTVSRTLAENRADLARTLCTLPLGVASYAQTSSWGEMFNVRIVEFFLKDQNSNAIIQRSELPQQRGDTSTPSLSACEKFYDGKAREVRSAKRPCRAASIRASVRSLTSSSRTGGPSIEEPVLRSLAQIFPRAQPGSHRGTRDRRPPHRLRACADAVGRCVRVHILGHGSLHGRRRHPARRRRHRGRSRRRSRGGR
jgi:phospholipid/cholesterol/gamma-HCH transport system substrate-binding protein